MTEPIPSPPAAEVSKDARMWGMLCHLSTFSAVFTGVGMVLGPLVVWLLKRNDYPFVDDQGKEALNFQITMTIALVCSLLLCIVFIGFLLLPVVGILDIVFTIIASIRASDGIAYRYPFALRLIK